MMQVLEGLRQNWPAFTLCPVGAVSALQTVINSSKVCACVAINSCLCISKFAFGKSGRTGVGKLVKACTVGVYAMWGPVSMLSSDHLV